MYILLSLNLVNISLPRRNICRSKLFMTKVHVFEPRTGTVVGACLCRSAPAASEGGRDSGQMKQNPVQGFSSSGRTPGYRRTCKSGVRTTPAILEVQYL